MRLLLFPESLVGPLYLFEFLLRLRIIRVPVWMKFHGKTSIRLLDLFLRRARREAKNHVRLLIGRIHDAPLKGSYKPFLNLSDKGRLTVLFRKLYP